MQKEPVQTSPQSTDIQVIRNFIANKALIAISIIAALGLPLSFLRLTVVGWQPVMAVNVLAACIIWGLTLFRHRLSKDTKSSAIVIVTFMAGLANFLNFGQSGPGLPFLLISLVVAAVLMGKRAALFVLAAGIGGILMVALGFDSGALTLSVDLSAYNVAFKSWMVSLFTFVLLGSGIIAIIVGLNRALMNSIAQLKAHSEQLESLVDARTKDLKQEIAERKIIESSLRVSEEQYHNAVETQSELITQCTASGQYLFVNEAYCLFSGKDKKSLIFSSVYDDIPQEERGDLKDYFASFTPEASHKNTENHIRSGSGEIRYFEWSNTASFDETGQISEIQSVGRDITERRIAEQALQQSEQRLSDYADAASDWFWELDENLRVVMITDTIMQYNGGINPKALYGMTRHELAAHTNGDEEIWRQHQEDLDARRPIRVFEYTFIDAQGISHEWSISGRAVYDEKGNFTGYRGVGRDVTDRVQAQLEISSQRDELELLNQQKNKFFSIMAHDLKNPFNVMIGYANMIDTMGDGLSREKMIEMAGSISITSHNLYQLLEDLLAWGQSQMNLIKFEPELISSKEIIESSIKNQADVASSKDISLVLQPAEVKIYADPEMIMTVIRNLVSNAIKFTPPHGKIIIGTESTLHSSGEKEVTISVTDTGVGMTKAQVGQLFRLDANQSTWGTEGEPGTGLGLLLCKEFVEKHGGHISVQSEKDAGTTIRFVLPTPLQAKTKSSFEADDQSAAKQ